MYACAIGAFYEPIRCAPKITFTQFQWAGIDLIYTTGVTVSSDVSILIPHLSNQTYTRTTASSLL